MEAEGDAAAVVDVPVASTHDDTDDNEMDEAEEEPVAQRQCWLTGLESGKPGRRTY